MKTKLTHVDIKYLRNKQFLLDSEIMKKHNITQGEWVEKYDIRHDIALRLELAEFVNECRDIWKYWKQQAVDRNKLLNEAIDVIHFVFLKLNKSHISFEDEVKNIDYWTDVASEYIGERVEEHHLHQLITEDYSEFYILGFILSILDRYGFTAKNIIDEYNLKNAENFERLKNGY